MGRLAYYQNDADLARRYGEECLSIAQELGDDWLIAYALHLLGLAAHLMADYAKAGAYYEQSLALRERLGELVVAGAVRRLAGLVALRQGDYARAHRLWIEGLNHTRELGNHYYAGLAMTNFACLAAAQGEWERAVRFAGAGESLLATADTVPIPLYQVAVTEALDAARAALAEEAYAAARAEGRAMTLEQAVTYALDVPPPA
jgi:non-specific serine/threonine protein kinase